MMKSYKELYAKGITYSNGNGDTLFCEYNYTHQKFVCVLNSEVKEFTPLYSEFDRYRTRAIRMYNLIKTKQR